MEAEGDFAVLNMAGEIFANECGEFSTCSMENLRRLINFYYSLNLSDFFLPIKI